MRKKDQPLISFVIPVYKKSPETFRETLRSLFDMSYKQIEVICVFDGPDEALQQVTNDFEVRSFVIPHGGAPKARNFGYTKTTGRYVSFWDADCAAKPEMARIWAETFKENPGASFVYSGYEFRNEMGAVESQMFDPYLLTCGNYIATMFPMKREVFPGFDESLQAGQDWDLWLTLVDQGHVGVAIEGYGFITDYPDVDSISGQGWGEKRAATIQAVKEKHGIPERDTVVLSANYRLKALHLAKLLNADTFVSLEGRPHSYKCVLVLGTWPNDSRFVGAPADCVKLQYWLPQEIAALEDVRYKTVVDLLRNNRKEATLNLCNEVVSQKRLADLGIEPGQGIRAEIVPLPTDVDDLETTLPRDFRVLLDIGDAYKPVFRDIRAVLPYIQIDELEAQADITKYSLLVSFHQYPTVDEGIRRFLLNGRNVISNVTAPYCGYVDLEVDFGTFKDKMIDKIRAARELPFNAKAQAHYKKIADPSAFRDQIKAIRERFAAKLEVVA